MEQVIVGQFNEIKRHKPSVLFVPNIDSWYEVMRDTLGFKTFQSLLRGVMSTDQVLLLATADQHWDYLPRELQQSFFGYSNKNRIEIDRPSSVSVHTTCVTDCLWMQPVRFCSSY